MTDDEADDTQDVIQTHEAFSRATKYLAAAWGGPVLVVGMTESLADAPLKDVRMETCIKNATSCDVFSMLAAFMYQAKGRFESDAGRCGCRTCLARLEATQEAIGALGVELLDELLGSAGRVVQ